MGQREKPKQRLPNETEPRETLSMKYQHMKTAMKSNGKYTRLETLPRVEYNNIFKPRMTISKQDSHARHRGSHTQKIGKRELRDVNQRPIMTNQSIEEAPHLVERPRASELGESPHQRTGRRKNEKITKQPLASDQTTTRIRTRARQVTVDS